jgi:hypothetical protein
MFHYLKCIPAFKEAATNTEYFQVHTRVSIFTAAENIKLLSLQTDSPLSLCALC